MACYRIKRKSGAILVGVYNSSVGNKTYLYERLEAVADTCDKAVTVVKKIVNLVLYKLVSEERQNEFARAVRLVAAGEAAGVKEAWKGPPRN